SFSQVMARVPFPGEAFFGSAAFFYLFVSAFGVTVHAILEPVRRRFESPANPARRRLLSLAGKALMAAPVAAMGYGTLIGRTDFQVNEIDVRLPDIPAGLDGLRILQLSDIHLGAFLSEKELARVIDASCGLQAHIAFVTGDYIST